MILKRADTANIFALQNDHLMKRSESHEILIEFYWATHFRDLMEMEMSWQRLRLSLLPFYILNLSVLAVLRCACDTTDTSFAQLTCAGRVASHSCYGSRLKPSDFLLSIHAAFVFVYLTCLHFGILSLFVFISLGQAVFPRPFAILEGVWWFSSRSGIGNGNNPEQSKMFKADFCLSTGS